MTKSQIATRFQNLKNRLVRLSERRKVLREQLVELKQKRSDSQAREELLSKTRSLLSALGSMARSTISETIDPLGTEAMREIFGPNAQYRTIFKELPKGGYSARIVSGNGEQLGSPLATEGGSAAEVLSDAVLRPILVCLNHPRLARVMLLDEPWAGVDEDRLGRLGAFIKNLSSDLSVQWIITTHAPGELDIYADTIITLPME